MAIILAVANQKGGVGKTTTSVNLATALFDEGQRVLLVDMDPQGNATTGVGIDKNGLELSCYDMLMGQSPLSDVIVHTEVAGIDVVPANGDLTAAEVGLMEDSLREKRLDSTLDSARSRYDYILIDCPPSLNMLTLNALVAADRVLVPLQTEYYALEGVSALRQTIEQISSSRNPGLKVDGYLRTMHDRRNNLGADVSAQLLEYFGDEVYRTVIPRNVRLAEAPSHGMPVMRYDRSSRGAAAYSVLAGEILKRHGNI
ncbi:MAG: AAA family ATPase [Pseudomonadota bacterium]|nr:AAA family ATPase [Pseudomonadota bacterium]